MNRNKRKNLKSFTITVLCCSMCISVIAAPLFFKTKKSALAGGTYSSQKYEPTQKSFQSNILIYLTDIPLFIFVDVNTTQKLCSATCYPKAVTKNSILNFNTDSPESSVEDIIGTKINRRVFLSSAALENIIDSYGGITAPTPFGLPSPSKPETLIAEDQTVRLFGKSACALLRSEKFPDSEHLEYNALLFCETLKSIFNSISADDYKRLFANTETNLSYRDIFDYAPVISACAFNYMPLAPNGVWMNEEYMLFE